MKVLEVFSQEQIDMMLTALNEKANKHRGIAKRTFNAGYGKATTEIKAEAHEQTADSYEELASLIAENSI